MALTKVGKEGVTGISNSSNATAITIDSSERVGIGHASPTASLDVRRGDAAGVVAEFHNNSGFGVDVGTDSDSVAYVSGGYTQALTFKTNAGSGQVERMRINSAGNVGIATSPDSSLHVASDAANFVARFVNDGNNVNRLGIFVQTGTDDGSGTVSFFDAYDGNGDATGKLVTVSGTFQLTDTSDERLKQDIVDTTVSGLTSVNAMKVRDYAYKRNPTQTIKAGFVAQELQTAFPSAVSYSENDSDKILSVSRERLVPVLVKAIQELSVKNDALEARLTALEDA